MADGFIGEVRLFTGDFTPRGWLDCDGRLLPIIQNQALFSILGTSYGGDGFRTFALPDLRGRVAVGAGQTPSGDNLRAGDTRGVASVALTVNEMPPHTHALVGGVRPADDTDPAGANLAAGGYATYLPGEDDGLAHPGTLGNVGTGQAHENRQPFLSLRFIICTQGIFPGRA